MEVFVPANKNANSAVPGRGNLFVLKHHNLAMKKHLTTFVRSIMNNVVILILSNFMKENVMGDA